MKLAGEAQAELLKIAAVGLVALALFLLARKSAQAAGGAISDAVDAVMAAPGRAVDAVKETVASAAASVFMPRVGNDGWQFFPQEGVAIAPDGSYWRGTKKIWSPT